MRVESPDMTLEIGITANPIPPVELTVASAVSAEADGYDSIWYPDHLMGWFPKSLWTVENSSIVNLLPSPHLYLDPAIVLALVAQSTTRLRVATGVTDPIRRPPAELARTFVTLSLVSQGRAIMGIGAGEKENTEPYGLDFRKQVSRLEEALHIVRLLWGADGPVSFDGRFWKLDRAIFELKPYEGVDPPIWVGAHGPRMLGITGRYGDGWYPSYPMTPSEYAEKLALVRKAATDAGRDPMSIRAGYQMYVVVGEDHETTHRIMSSPLAGAMALVAPAAQWETAGFQHPFGSGFEGLRDYVPEWYSEQELKDATSQFSIEVIHPTIVHGTVDEVVDQVAAFVEVGLEHVAFTNMAPLAGFEYLPATQAGLKEVAARLR
ncbi:MAG TPA: LLM class flavin-dependent oxidoreductase [Actinomycetota bacterium]|nr:LLM class flavin-dependent oxidoreductase [Actinomycetota bacterium]